MLALFSPGEVCRQRFMSKLKDRLRRPRLQYGLMEHSWSFIYGMWELGGKSWRGCSTRTVIPNTLTDVQVNAKKALIEKKIDRTVFNVENSISAIGTDALELLSKVPGVRVLNDKVSLVGKGEVNVMINDKLVPL